MQSRSIVGIHIRRGDIMKSSAKSGRNVATKEYYLSALDLLRRNGLQNAIYIVCTNDPEWARQNLLPEIATMHVVETEDPVIDLAILTMTDHLILSVGTYSFFAGYLSDAQTVIYYARGAEPGSFIANMTRNQDFWLPEWIPLE
jgi:galactoside 2-L-fucosyltransferase 1/2